MTPLGSERPAVQNPLLRYASEVGWAYLPPDEALNLRRGASGSLLYPTLRDKLILFNPGIVDEKNVDAVIARIEGVRTSIEGNQEVHKWLTGAQTIYLESEKRRLAVALIDYSAPVNNTFHVTDEWAYTNGQKSNRADAVFLINGVPVAVAETKAATRPDGIDEAVIQLRRYQDETPEMMVAPQIFEATHLHAFYYGATWNLDRKGLFNWKDEASETFEARVKSFFSRERFLRLLRDGVVFFTKDDELRKIILRQHQTRAVERVVERALDPHKRTGLVWHTQGSGKTFTMITAARRILEDPAFGKPTVLMLVDRNELEGQLSGWVTNVLGEGKAEVVTSKRHLRQLLRSDYRGLIVSMIHKFDKADKDLCGRSDVFVFIDEAHRSTGGDLGNFLVAALPQATFFGFTGTPIDRIAYGKGTFKVFGQHDPQGYLDKYSIEESIADRTTLPLNYAFAPNDIRVPQEMLEKEFFALAEAEGICDIEELNRILEKAVTLKAFLKSKDRLRKVAAFVAEHFKRNVNPLGYKAFLVGVDRAACALYKKELDRLLPPEWSEVVYTSPHNDDPLTGRYRLDEAAEKRVRKSFAKPGRDPKILIVTEKLLTGYDAPVLYCMYLDKPMRDHALLQAIARVNRPHEGDGLVKRSGLIIDFVGIFERLEKALAFDSPAIQNVVKSLDVLRSAFLEAMRVQAPPYLALCRGQLDDKAVERALGALDDREKREAFFNLIRQLQAWYEILSPDPALRDHIKDYTALCRLFQVLRARLSTRPPLLSDLMRKTELIVRETARTDGLDSLTAPLPIDEKALQALKKKQAPPGVKILNLVKTLAELARTQGAREPFLIPIGERAERILKEFEDRSLATEAALKELESLMGEYHDAKREAAATGLSADAFAVYWELNRIGAPNARGLALKVDAAFERLPNFADNASERRQLKAELYRILLEAVGRERMVNLAEQLIGLRTRA